MVDIGVVSKIFFRVKPECLLSCMYLELGNKKETLNQTRLNTVLT